MRRLERLVRGEPPRVLDLFAGAGGLSLGFHRAGFRIDGAMEMDPLAARTHARNFHPEDQERAWALWQHCVKTGEDYEIEYRVRHHSGRYRWVLA